MEWLFYGVSMLYKLVIMVTTGIILFDVYFNKVKIASFTKQLQAYKVFAMRAFFIIVICSMFEQSIMWLEQFGPERFDFIELFFKSAVGQIWVAIFMMSIIGLFLHKLSTVYAVLWVMILFFLESTNGHIVDLDSYAIIFDFVHLICGAIWVGGIVTFVLCWKKHKDELLQLMQAFMKVIWITVIVMALSGTLLSILIIPDVLYLLYTSWGQLLIAKVVFVLAALYCGYRVRKAVKVNQIPHIKMLLVEVSMLIAVILLTGLLTVFSPEPASNDLDQHEMGSELHYTVEISPNRSGNNEWFIKLWTLESEGEIASVEAIITDTQKGGRTTKSYVLTEQELDAPYDFNGFVESRYSYEEGLRLPYPSTWKQEVRITFTSGFVREFKFTFKN